MLIASLLDDPFSIERLKDESGVSIRTIRFYQQEGLLEPAGKQGVRVFYGPSDVTRIRLIKALQERRLRLGEIRRLLAGLDEEGVARELRRLEAEAPSVAARHSSAADYARSVREGTREDLLASTQAVYGTPVPVPLHSPGSTTRRATYDRITITPDIELHVRGPLSQFENTLLLQLLQAADRIYQSRSLERL